VREDFTLTPNPSPKGEGKNGAAQRYVAWFSFLGGNIKLTHYLARTAHAPLPCPAPVAVKSSAARLAEAEAPWACDP
jgi:hypothetical protein